MARSGRSQVIREDWFDIFVHVIACLDMAFGAGYPKEMVDMKHSKKGIRVEQSPNLELSEVDHVHAMPAS